MKRNKQILAFLMVILFVFTLPLNLFAKDAVNIEQNKNEIKINGKAEPGDKVNLIIESDGKRYHLDSIEADENGNYETSVKITGVEKDIKDTIVQVTKNGELVKEEKIELKADTETNVEPKPEEKPNPEEKPGSGGETKPDRPRPDRPNKFGKITLSIDKKTINKGYVLRPTTIDIKDGDILWDILENEMRRKGIAYDHTFTEQYNSVYIAAIDGDGEFDHGQGSGWMYSVNGVYPDYGVSLYELSDGDVVELRYTTNLGRDLGQTFKEEGKENQKDKSAKKEPVVDNSLNIEENNKKLINYKDSSQVSNWAYYSLEKAVNLGFIEGYNGKLNPKGQITRAEFTKIIVSALGLEKDLNSPKVKFNDVKEKDWYYDFVEIASQNKIINGTDQGFKPNDKITREEIAVIMSRSLKLSEIDETIRYKDKNKISNWAAKDVYLVSKAGIINGTGENFEPKSFATREMAITIIIRAYEKYINLN